MSRFGVADKQAGIVRTLDEVIRPLELDDDIHHVFLLVAAALLALLVGVVNEHHGNAAFAELNRPLLNRSPTVAFVLIAGTYERRDVVDEDDLGIDSSYQLIDFIPTVHKTDIGDMVCEVLAVWGEDRQGPLGRLTLGELLQPVLHGRCLHFPVQIEDRDRLGCFVAQERFSICESDCTGEAKEGLPDAPVGKDHVDGAFR